MSELEPLPEATQVIPVIDPSGPVDWLEAAGAIDPVMVWETEYSEEWEDFKRFQMDRAWAYLGERRRAVAAPDLETVTRRAAVILRAEPEAPECERMLGIRVAAEFEGQEVKCRNSSCRRKWVCQPEDPYFDATGNRATGICVSCMLTETRTDAAVPEIEGQIVTVTRPRNGRKAVTSG